MFKVGNSYVSPVPSKYENSVTKIMSIRVHKNDQSKMDKVIENLELMGFDYINHRFSCSGMQCYDEVMQILGVLKKGEHWCEETFRGE